MSWNRGGAQHGDSRRGEFTRFEESTRFPFEAVVEVWVNGEHMARYDDIKISDLEQMDCWKGMVVEDGRLILGSYDWAFRRRETLRMFIDLQSQIVRIRANWGRRKREKYDSLDLHTRDSQWYSR